MKGLIQFLKSKLFFKQLLLSLGILLVMLLLLLLLLNIFTHHGRTRQVPDFTSLNFNEAIKIGERKGLRIEISDSVFIRHKNPGTVISQIPKPNFRVKKGRRVLLTINALSPEYTTMPNLVGISYRTAKTILESRGLEINRLSYADDMAFNNVLRQNYKGKTIEEGTKIEKYSKIDLVLGNGYRNNTSSLPNLISKTYDEAKNSIFESYFNVGSVLFDETVKTFFDSTNAKVYRQYPVHSINNSVLLASRVDIWLTTDTIKINNELKRTQE